MNLSMEDLNLLSNDDKNRYMVLERLFDSEGWAFIKKWSNANIDEAKQHILNASNWDQTLFARGALLAYDQFAKFEEISEAEILSTVEQVKESLLAKEELDNE